MKPRNILITGTSRGIGAALVDACVVQGWQVIACQRAFTPDPNCTDRLNQGSSCHRVELDVTNQSSVQKAFKKIAQQFSHIDVLVNNAGVFPEPTDFPFESLKPEWFKEAMEVNLIGAVRVTQVCLPLLKKGQNPRIVNISSGPHLSRSVKDVAIVMGHPKPRSII